MPTYDYACLACGHELVIEHSITAPAKKKCPRCGKSKLERRIGAGASFVFKGSGFYSTDYRTKTPAPGDVTPPVAKPDATPAAAAGADAKKPARGDDSAAPRASKPDTAEASAPANDAPSKPAAADAKPAKRRDGRKS